ncbi:ribokinase [Sodiomyces alkalinus F11]|uniref:Ribokinase n=1 Tax=Sodiomyces alkalinus (strain CBS 110278 / VKM F-3762 / F11) TaxID=1314773 RepID=A0A3N2Q1R4_SODAK|nr:ribokinase [Sodiomyces alkalinus F11]ROT40690.1 ribokinase [Sodiomyces alkalinus F11]
MTSSSSTSLPRITVLGSLNIDLTSYVPHHPLPGETLTSNGLVVSPGGKGANQAVACAKLSRGRDHDKDPSSITAVVAMVGAVAQDSHGSLLLKNLAAHGIDASQVLQVSSETTTTGTAIIIVDEPTGQNRIIFTPGANSDPALSHYTSLPETSSADARPDLLVMQLEIPLATVLAALESAKRAAVPVLLNPAPAQPLPDHAYAGLAHLVVNETEASILSGCAESDLDDLDGLRRVAKWFLDKGVVNFVATLGGRGVYFRSADGKDALVPAEKAKVVDTTAAGDTFVGSYAVSAVTAAHEAKPFDIEAAIRRANRVAAKTVERKGAQDSIPWGDEVN